MIKQTIPNFQRYTITQDGVLYDTVNQKVLTGKAVGPDKKYVKVYLVSDTGKRVYCNVHVLVALTFIPNPLQKPYVDHIDRDTLNNKVDNLRWATPIENSQNLSKRMNTTSLFMGVCWNRDSCKWIASIKIDGKVKRLGAFTDELEAAKAYNDAAIQAGYLHYNKDLTIPADSVPTHIRIWNMSERAKMKERNRPKKAKDSK